MTPEEKKKFEEEQRKAAEEKGKRLEKNLLEQIHKDRDFTKDQLKQRVK
jgi:hypothetical protein